MVERGNGHVTGEKGLEEVDVGLAECMEGLQREQHGGWCIEASEHSSNIPMSHF